MVLLNEDKEKKDSRKLEKGPNSEEPEELK